MAMMVHFIADCNQKPDEKEFERVSKKLVNEDLDICQSLADLIKSCWSTQPNLRPTALKVQKYLQELTKERKRSRDADICLSNYSHQHDKTKKTVWK